MTDEPTLKFEPSGYKLNPEKLKGASPSILPYLFSCFYFKEEFEYFDLVKPYLDIPEPRKSIEELQQELEEKFEELLVKTKRKFAVSKETAEYYYNERFDRIFSNFHYAKEHGHFMPKLTIGTLDGSYLVSTGSGDLNWITSSTTPSFVIKQGNSHQGYYTISDGYYRFYMKEKPNMIFRWFVYKLMGFKWVDEKDT